MKEKFEDHKFARASLELIAQCSAILDEYEKQGYKLTLRQLYYQLVARDIIENSLKSYKRIGDLVSNARQAGLLDWGMIEDRNRETYANSHWETPGGILRSAAYSFRLDRWVGQKNYVEVFVEKDALSGIILPVCRDLDVKFTANKGYSSSSAMYVAAKRLAREYRDDKEIHVIYLGDHDPSGIDMTRDIQERFEKFAHGRIYLNVHRLALNYDQIEMWQPPENPAKESDSRFEAYAAQFGESSWELDAVDPSTLAGLVKDKIEDLIDWDIWNQVAEKEHAYKQELESLAKRY